MGEMWMPEVTSRFVKSDPREWVWAGQRFFGSFEVKNAGYGAYSKR
jgi:hypothetical protein